MIDALGFLGTCLLMILPFIYAARKNLKPRVPYWVKHKLDIEKEIDTVAQEAEDAIRWASNHIGAVTYKGRHEKGVR